MQELVKKFIKTQFKSYSVIKTYGDKKVNRIEICCGQNQIHNI